MRKFNKRQREAIKSYYYNAKLINNENFIEKSKTDCLDEIVAVIRNSRNIKDITACAGTFWFTWKDQTITIHNKSNWWRMKKVK